MTNKHNGHIASCLCCEKLYGDLGESDYSDITPGYPGYINCKAGIFSFGQNDYFPDILKTLHNAAKQCKFFTPNQE